MFKLSEFSYSVPTSIEFGNGVINKLEDLIRKMNGTKAMIIADSGVVEAGIVDEVIKSLSESISYVVYSEIQSEPTLQSVEEGLEIAKSKSCDIVIGVGGGSSLDTAKTIGLMLNNRGNIKDFVGLDKVPNKGYPTIAIPTTAGTGSELTRFAVLSDKENKAKLSIGSFYNCPDVALCDPELTVTLPPNITASTGMDALTHALESFINKATQPISEGMSLQSMKLISENLRLAVVQGDNIEARYNMLLASSIAAMAFNVTRLGLSHALAIPLGAHFNIPHGIVNAMLLPEVMEYNLISAEEKFGIIAEIFGENTAMLSKREAAERAVVVIRRLKNDIGIAQTLTDYGVQESDLDLIAEEAMQSGNVPVNPRKPTIEDFKNICRKLM